MTAQTVHELKCNRLPGKLIYAPLTIPGFSRVLIFAGMPRTCKEVAYKVTHEPFKGLEEKRLCQLRLFMS